MRKMWLFVLLLLVQIALVSPVSADEGSTDRVIFGGSVVVDEEDDVGDLVVFGGSADVIGRVRGDLVVFGGSARVDGQVRGSVIVFGGGVDLRSTAIVGEDVVTFGGSLRREPGATIGGSTVGGPGRSGFTVPFGPPFPLRFDGNPVWWFFSGLIKGLLGTLVLLGVAIVVVSLFPRQLEVTGDVLENLFWQSAGIGVLVWLGALVLTPILIISLIGIPVAIVLWIALFFVAFFYGLVVVADLIGEKVLRSAGARPAGSLVNVLVGMLLVMVVLVPLNAITGGCLGTLLMLALVTPAVGAVALSRFGTRRWRPGLPGPLPTDTMPNSGQSLPGETGRSEA